jgi:diguanylate cyclase (GGDEF)-like protein
VAAYVAALGLGPGAGYAPWRDGWLANVALALPGLLCLARAARPGPNRLAAALFGLGMLSFAAGNVAYVAAIQFQVEPSVPSPADVGYLAFYPLACAGAIAMLRDARRLGEAIWLDGAVGAAGAATALALLMNPVLSGIAGNAAEVLVTGAYPVGDLLLISMLAGTVAVRGLRAGATATWLAAGLLCFCAADVVFALRVAAGSYQVGTILDALWAVGVAVMAHAIRRPAPAARAPRGSAAMLAVPLVATVVAVGALLWATGGGVPRLTVGLATATLALAALRTLASFREVQRLADARRQARTDDVTGLENRRALYEAAAARIAGRPDDGRLALLLLDLDGFKEINDALGHHVGDVVLREVAGRLAAGSRPGDTLARLGGDEFAVLVGLAPGEDADAMARRLLERLAAPVQIDGVTMRIGASVGIAEHPEDGGELGTLLRRADIAMYAAKRRRSGVERYAPDLDGHSRSRLEALQELGGALAGDQLVLHYQPKSDVRTGRVIGVEALVRWAHPERGLLFPDAFLPLVEQSGRTRELTDAVLTLAVAQARAWRAVGLDLPIAVNLAAGDLLDDALPARIATLLDAHGLTSDALAVEITEGSLMVDRERGACTVTALRALGIAVAIDDYGTGYSSLGYLRDLAVDELKIDRSFVSELAGNDRDAAIVRSTIDLAHALGVAVVAEGVEDPGALEVLAALDCDRAQGYHLGRPMPPEALASALAGVPA